MKFLVERPGFVDLSTEEVDADSLDITPYGVASFSDIDENGNATVVIVYSQTGWLSITPNPVYEDDEEELTDEDRDL